MTDLPRVAVIGAGNMGRNHIRVLSEIDEVELVAFSDQNPDSQQVADQFGVRRYEDFEEMIKDEGVEAVTVAAPTPYHLRMAEIAVKNGAHVLIEKPIAATVEEADTLIDLSASADVTVSIGHIERFNPVIRAIKGLIEEGAVGDNVLTIDCVRIGGFPAAEPATDVITDLAIHDIDIMRFLTGKKFSVLGAHGSRTIHSREVDSAQILLGANGVGGTSKANWITPSKIRTISVTGDRGHLEADYIGQTLRLIERQVPISSSYLSQVEARDASTERSVDVVRSEPLREEIVGFLGTFVASLEARAETVPLEDARDALALALEARRRIEEAR